MQCFVYRSSVKEGLYIYLANQDALNDLPEAVRRQLGTPELALTFDLHPARKLGSEDPAEVMNNLNEQGFHLQMPKNLEPQIRALIDQFEKP